MSRDDSSQTWTNWAGNQTFEFRRLVEASSPQEIAAAVRAAAADGRCVRAIGSGHSFTPIVQTSGDLIDMSGWSGVESVDIDRGRAVVRAGTPLSAIGARLWEAGLSLANQGDIDKQTLAGAVSTGTKGSGTRFGTLSSTITALELVTASGELVRIDATDGDLLHAAQVSLGLLGVFTRIELQAVPRYFLRESNVTMHVDELLERWDELNAQYRHFSFWWMPTDRSASVYELPDTPADHAIVKLLQEEEAAPSVTLEGDAGSRLGRAHLIYPDIELGAPAYELEYVVQAARDKEAFQMMRRLMLDEYPEQTSPVQIRWQQRDEGLLSPQYRQDSVSVSVSGIPGTVWEPFLRRVDQELAEFDARPHWGKVHFLTCERAQTVYPAMARFLELRRESDPNGVFLNDSLGELFA